MPDGTAHDSGGCDEKGFRHWLRLLLTQVQGTKMYGMSAQVTMLQVKGGAKDDRGEPQYQ